MNHFNSLANLIPEYRAMAASPGTYAVSGLSRVHKAHWVAGLAETRSPLLVLVESETEAVRMCDDINAFGASAAVYPARDSHLINADAYSREYEHRRMAVLARIQESGSRNQDSGFRIIIATPEAASQTTFSPKNLTDSIITIKKDDELNARELFSRLTDNGYTRVDMVESLSQFSVRGSVVDIFPVNGQVGFEESPMPVRIDLWGDTVDSLSVFDVETQRSVEKITEVVVAPAIETAGDAALEWGSAPNPVAPAGEPCLSLPKECGSTTLFDYVHNVIVCEQTNCNEQFYVEYERMSDKAVVYFDTFPRKANDNCQSSIVNCHQLPPWNGEYNQLCQDLKAYLGNGYRVAVLAGTEKSAKSLELDLRDDGIPFERLRVLPGTLSAGFDYPEAKVACITHFGRPSSVSGASGAGANSSTGRRGVKPKHKSKAQVIRAVADINVGDYVVHDTYGIGIFEGVTKLSSDGAARDYIKLKYAGKDVLYVPVTQLDLIARYIGNTETASLKLSKLHTDTWFNTKARVRKAVEELARELIELYAKRMKAKGHKFSRDSREQLEFESRFPYIETRDQVTCVEQIKGDMQSVRPMDRLLCGDVGFGKTEVALRAVFKCVMEGKQCALLCPTTVLAWQHYQTAAQRMEGYPVNIELLSRFRTPKEQREVLQKLEAGIVDFVIGTHTLVGKSVKFNSLGLVIIDEEQRFGVTQKERLKEAFTGVDVLTLSATPIPRTLNMAMSGIRDMSVIETPPHDRLPVATYVIEHDSGVIAEAIEKELRRAGQVYYIHNRVETIVSCAAKLQQLVPAARIGIAHGRMDERELLNVWGMLLQREIDVLVCTTLVETGVDVPNVNTLIIENADRMGLAQLHQLRGRVGRTNRRAYAYFTFTQGKVLSEIATKRLDAVKEFTQFGAGFRIALRDLEIRGSGSVLGESQSGHLSAVGYETYVRLLEEAVQSRQNAGAEETAGDEGAAPSDAEHPSGSGQGDFGATQNASGFEPQICTVDIKSDAFIPESYISNQSQRIACYKRIAEIRDTGGADAADVIDELTDRYGALPKPVMGLVDAARIRNMGTALGMSEIVQVKTLLTFYWQEPDMKRLSGVSGELFAKMELNLTGRTGVSLRLGERDDGLKTAAAFLEQLIDC